ncbi:MAG TPA: glycoside hydrolase family 3 [Lachnospiraceae bacterium]|nr:glycoside hydrolase family 3 [Lachnospiraceae bacterium]
MNKLEDEKKGSNPIKGGAAQYMLLKKLVIILTALVVVLLISNTVLLIKLISNSNERKDVAQKINGENYLESSIASGSGTEEDPQVSGNLTEDNTDDSGASSEKITDKTDDTSSEEISTTETAVKSEDEELDRQVEEILKGMTLHEKICQMFIVTPEELTGYETCTAAGEATKACLNDYPVAGIIYFASNLESREQTTEMISNMKSYAKEINGLPFFVSVDEEGGMVARCADELGTTTFSNMYEYKDEGTETAYNNARTIAEDISQFGFNLDFAPVADTWSNYDNTVIGKRAYSDDFEQTAELVAAAVKGFNDGGVLCSLKHFPGHGDTSQDSHSGAAYVTKGIEELEQEELFAFKSGIDAGADFVMVGHLTMTGVDGMPASFSYTMVTEELKNKLGFKGVVITDALEMGAIANIYSSADAAVNCVEAGIDIMLMPANLSGAVDGIKSAVESGSITEERINESVRRIIKLKLKKLKDK